MADFTKPSSSLKRSKRSSPKNDNLQISVNSFGKRLLKLRLDAEDTEISLDERKKYAIYGLETVFKTDVASHILKLVSFIKKTRTIDVAKDFTQTQRDIQEISESEGGTSTSASDTTPKIKARKKSSSKFKTARSAAKNLILLLFSIKLDLGSATQSDEEKRNMVVNALKLIHNAEIIETVQKLQDVLKEIMEIEKREKTDHREQNSALPIIDVNEANDSSTTPNADFALSFEISQLSIGQLLAVYGSSQDFNHSF